jgi:hypothetical protein
MLTGLIYGANICGSLEIHQKLGGAVNCGFTAFFAFILACVRFTFVVFCTTPGAESGVVQCGELTLNRVSDTLRSKVWMHFHSS